jgi:hypothetical protein
VKLLIHLCLEDKGESQMPKLFRTAPIGALLSLLLLVTAHSSSAATYTVTNTNDSGPESLRWAITQANSESGPHTIEFNLANCPCVISLTSGQLSVDADVTIVGLGADQLAIERDATAGDFRIFLIQAGNAVTISDMTVRNGKDGFGGAGIYNQRSTLTLNNVKVNGNSTGNIGGGIVNDGTELGGFATMIINDSTITGNSAGWGGGVLNLGEAEGNATMTIRNSTVTGNTATSDGGGVRNTGQHGGNAILDVFDSVVTDNTAGSKGGGIYNVATESGVQPGVAVMTMTNSRVTFNGASTGGGVSNGRLSTLTMTNSAVAGNSATGLGSVGGIENVAATMSLAGSTVSNNSGSSNGGIFNELGTLSLTNSTVSNNTGGAIGGIFNYNPQNIGSLTFTNSTVSDNLATGSNGVGGIFNFEGRANAANSIIAGNTAAFGTPDAAGVFLSQGFNLVGDGGVSTGFIAPGDQVGTTPAPLDPLLGPLQDNGGPTFTHALLPGSPAIDAGDPGYAGPLTTDQRGAGFVRVYSGRIDIGAFELQPTGIVCPLPQGDWKNNSVWPVDGLTLGDETYTNGELLDILNTPVGRGKNADASIILAYQLIAAKLNIANGADGTSVISTIADADALLGGLAGRLPYGVTPSSSTGKLMTGYASILDAFNNGTTTIGCSL